jgi:S-adenosylmethionine:tRNA ribosyltransferase-isomerase
MKLSLFDYVLPEHLIAQTPEDKRDHSRLLKLDKYAKDDPKDYHFYDIVEMLDKDDVIVMNNTKVIPARLFGIKSTTKARIELLIIGNIDASEIKALTKPAKKIQIGDIIIFNSNVSFECIDIGLEGVRMYKANHHGDLLEIIESIGRLPLPPYIKHTPSDDSRYQTVYAKHMGSSAAPTAGLHFTKDIIQRLLDKGVHIIEITLHVGAGTFSTVKTEDIHNHRMHEETYMISEESALRLNEAKRLNRRIISVGTTSLRAIESNYMKDAFHSGTFKTSIFIYPGYTFKVVNGLITNFHLPKSTLLMLVSAFSQREYILKAYTYAISKEYRFFSFGDAMIII